MLMGEYDYTDNFVETETFWLSKVIFVLFLVDMSIVLMNLVIGLAVSDVDYIKRESNVQRLMNETFTVMYLEQVSHKQPFHSRIYKQFKTILYIF